MKTLIISPPPEPTSLNSWLKDLAVSTLENAGHEVRVSDLYSMNWKAVADAADYGPNASGPLKVLSPGLGPGFRRRGAHRGRPRRAGDAALGRHDHFPVPAVVVQGLGDAGHTEEALAGLANHRRSPLDLGAFGVGELSTSSVTRISRRTQAISSSGGVASRAHSSASVIDRSLSSCRSRPSR